MDKEKNTKWGKVTEALPNGQFKVDVDGKEGRYYSSGKIRIKKIKILSPFINTIKRLLRIRGSEALFSLSGMD